ncbi:MAG: hypothetical protein HC908_13635, partial [Calothrix sp. SM1_7_51]|nr:hypothetical protein [Calothrix sp. SM1_7_51]
SVPNSGKSTRRTRTSRAEQESQRAEQESQQKERLANYLRSQGIDPDNLPEV